MIALVDPWTALQFDNAVSLVGTVIEGAAQEMTNVGDDSKPSYKPKYTLRQLLDPAFRLPASDGDGDTDGLMGVDGVAFDEVA